MKKFLALLLALTMALALVACGGGDDAASDTTADSGDDAAASTGEFEEMTWKFACSATETSPWVDGAKEFARIVGEKTGGAITVQYYPADQLTAGNQTDGIQALMDGTTELSMHSNLIYSAFDPRFNVVSLPFVYDSYDDADAKFDGEAGAKLKEILSEYGLHCMGIAENGFREITNSKHEIKSVDDMKNLKVRVAGSNLLMECYKRWGADATNMNWSETYTALQQNTVEGQENPLPAIDAASVQEVQPYCSMWDAIYDCLFFCINENIYNSLTPQQQEVVDEAGQKAVEYERYINRSGDDEIKERWASQNGVTITEKEDMDIDSFKEAVDGIDDWFVNELKSQGYDDAKDLIEAFTKKDTSSIEEEERSFKLSVSVEESFISDEEDLLLKKRVNRILDLLTDHQREIVYLHFIEEMPYEEIAVMLDMKIQTVRGQVFKAMEKLRKLDSKDYFLFFLILYLHGVSVFK